MPRFSMQSPAKITPVAILVALATVSVAGPNSKAKNQSERLGNRLAGAPSAYRRIDVLSDRKFIPTDMPTHLSARANMSRTNTPKNRPGNCYHRKPVSFRSQQAHKRQGTLCHGSFQTQLRSKDFAPYRGIIGSEDPQNSDRRLAPFF